MLSYSELIKIPTFAERLKYLKLSNKVGEETFGVERYLNQKFYRSWEWKHIRQQVIVRDMGCDLGVPGVEIDGLIIIHHMNPISPKDIVYGTALLMDPEYLICVSKKTHNAIHYGYAETIAEEPIERKPNDTCPWK